MSEQTDKYWFAAPIAALVIIVAVFLALGCITWLAGRLFE